MGMQNAMVTMISGSVVRTTHLTGMFTDLGIDLSSLFFQHRNKDGLKNRIGLRLAIIFFFLAGCVAGGYLFGILHYHTFFVPVVLLVVVMFYDYFRFRALKVWHRVKSKN